jgi:hypothetical protein
MKMAFRVLVGASLGTLVLWVSIYFYGLLAVWSPWSNWWWAHHPALVSSTSKILAFVPCVIALGVIFTKLFKTLPILSAFVAMGLAMLIAFAETLRTPELLLPTVRMNWEWFAPFMVGPPLTVYVLNRLRSNNRWGV